MLPKEHYIQIPLLKALVDLGGQGKSRDVYEVVTRLFPEVPAEDFLEELAAGANKWANRIRWVRQELVANGQMSSPQRGIWAITELGRKRISTGSLIMLIGSPALAVTA